ncbi:MAG: hypothetical protein HZA08_10770 [Nitrospirae bacterium]|nr:hypothetical protein [Nitrospirota bacterium]
MTRVRLLFFLILIYLIGIPCPAFSNSNPSFDHIFIVVLENTNAEDAYSQPFMRMIANQGAYLSNFHGVTHPSQPNYLALTSGSTWNVNNDMITLDTGHIGDLLEAKKKSWKVYVDKYPGNCFLNEKRGAYVRKHVPFLSYKNIQLNPARCARIVNSTEMLIDIKDGTLPNFSLYIPDNNNNGHDTGVAYADTWLKETFEHLLKDKHFTRGLLFIVIFDEGGKHNDDNHVYAIFWGDSVSPGSVSNTRYDHYSLLRTVEDSFKLGTLGRNDKKAGPITGIWR